MAISPAAGKPADPSILVNVPKLITAYYELRPDVSNPSQRVVFGTSGHRGSAFEVAFNEWHILTITQAICDYRKLQSHRRAAIPGDRYPRSVRTCICERDGSACGKWHRRDARRRHAVHPHPGRLPCDSAIQPQHESQDLPTVSSSRRLTILPMTGALNTTLRTEARPIRA